MGAMKNLNVRRMLKEAKTPELEKPRPAFMYRPRKAKTGQTKKPK